MVCSKCNRKIRKMVDTLISLLGKTCTLIVLIIVLCFAFLYYKYKEVDREMFPNKYPIETETVHLVNKRVEEYANISTIDHKCAQLNKVKHYYYTTKFMGGIGNQMFQYAFLYSTAKKYRQEMVMPYSKQLKETFSLIPPAKSTKRRHIPDGCFKRILDKYDCAYDDNMFEDMEQDIEFYGYFQSWKYFKDYANEIRQKFKFTPSVQRDAQEMLEDVLQKYDRGKNTRPLIVGVHIRRGDKITDQSQGKFGHKPADENYVLRAMQYFRDRFEGVIFVFASDDRLWTQKLMLGQEDVHIIGGRSAEADMCALTMTDHSIITVGTFGWWIAFLTNGTTIYYRYPFRFGSPFEREFHGNTREFFYPNWIGMD